MVHVSDFRLLYQVAEFVRPLVEFKGFNARDRLKTHVVAYSMTLVADMLASYNHPKDF